MTVKISNPKRLIGSVAGLVAAMALASGIAAHQWVSEDTGYDFPGETDHRWVQADANLIDPDHYSRWAKGLLGICGAPHESWHRYYAFRDTGLLPHSFVLRRAIRSSEYNASIAEEEETWAPVAEFAQTGEISLSPEPPTPGGAPIYPIGPGEHYIWSESHIYDYDASPYQGAASSDLHQVGCDDCGEC